MKIGELRDTEIFTCRNKASGIIQNGDFSDALL